MTNYEYLKYMINNQKAVEVFFCRMIENAAEYEYCDSVCPLAEKCKRGKSGIAEYLGREHKTPLADVGRFQP